MKAVRQTQFTQNVAFLRCCDLFTKESKSIRDVASSGYRQKFTDGKYVCYAGQKLDAYHLVMSGTVHCLIPGDGEEDGEYVRSLKFGEPFDNAVFDESTFYEFDYRAVGTTVVLTIPKTALDLTPGLDVEWANDKSMLRTALANHRAFRELEPYKLAQIASCVTIDAAMEGDVLYGHGDKFTDIVIMLDGSCVLSTTGVEYEQRSVFGEEYFWPSIIKNKNFQGILTMTDFGRVAKLSLEVLEGVLTSTEMKLYIEKQQQHPVAQFFNNSDRSWQKCIKGFTLDSFSYISQITRGQFSNVYMIADRESHKLYALKAITKRWIIEKNYEKFVQSEREC
jgi:hypothetical protein